ncbi:MAG: hypothetical protein R2728_05675 [Chitinophagales bacterium]
MTLALNNSALSEKVWSPLQLWILALVLTISGVVVNLLNVEKGISVILILGSFLLFAAGNPVLNAVRANMAKSLMWSLPIFIVHSIVTYLLFSWVGPDNEIAIKRVFSVIVIFYIMATMLSVMFRLIYRMFSEN